ncbi:MAG TPA: hypothetical protein VN673_15370 [Clostridia bacterium]|nr:hypothetical protein [Clostridia bacterium]
MILTSTQEYVPHAPGVFPAVCVDLIDLGLREMEFQGRHRMVPRLCIVWETEAPDGTRHSISRTFTASLNAKANLSEFLAHWRGKVITPGETIDMSKLIGLCCTLVISHQQRTDGTGTFSRVEAAGRPTRTITPSGTYDGKLMRAQITARAASLPIDRPDAASSGTVDDDVPF